MPSRPQRWRDRAARIRTNVVALYVAGRHPRVPWYAKALALIVVAYAVSPIDLIPDFIPVVGYLDDLLLIPLGVVLVVKLIPPAVWKECKQRANEGEISRRSGRIAAGVIVLLWLIVAAWVVHAIL
jgi:uncharacterized membrane protein YkvA (DUF1232 family)